jgi:hypothetical protein
MGPITAARMAITTASVGRRSLAEEPMGLVLWHAVESGSRIEKRVFMLILILVEVTPGYTSLIILGVYC